jgi:ankyrin repeat protein
MSWTTPFHEAVILGDVDKIRKLLEHGRYGVKGVIGQDIGTLLHCACMHGHVDMVRMLISEFQADTTVMDKHHFT